MDRISKSNLEEIFLLLKKLQIVNERNNYDGFLTQDIRPPEEFSYGVPTLEKDVYKKQTSMVEARFLFCGTWTNAGLGHKWLSLSEMESIWDNEKIIKQILIRQKNWTKSVPALIPRHCLSLFGIEKNEYEETYLAWDKDDSFEPKVYVYTGHEEKIFENIKKYIEFLITI